MTQDELPDSQPSLRDQQQQLTRNLIMQALIDVVIEEGVHAFTVQRVAEHAGVSHRTVYRHYPTRQAMLDGFGEFAEEYNATRGLGLPERLEDMPDHARRIFESFDADADAVRAIVQIRLIMGMQETSRRRRSEALREMLAASAPNLSPAELDGPIRAIRSLLTASTWYQMRTDFGVTGQEAGDAVAYAVKLILEDVARRNEAAAGGMNPGTVK